MNKRKYINFADHCAAVSIRSFDELDTSSSKSFLIGESNKTSTKIKAVSQFTLNSAHNNTVEMRTFQSNENSDKKNHLKVFGDINDRWYRTNHESSQDIALKTLLVPPPPSKPSLHPPAIEVLDGLGDESSIDQIFQKIDAYINHAKNVYSDGKYTS